MHFYINACQPFIQEMVIACRSKAELQSQSQHAASKRTNHLQYMTYMTSLYICCLLCFLARVAGHLSENTISAYADRFGPILIWNFLVNDHHKFSEKGLNLEWQMALFLEIVKAAAGLDTLRCRLREGCHCGRLPLH